MLNTIKTRLKYFSYRRILLFTLFLLATVFFSVAQQRFPKPEFESGHTQPPTITPGPRAEILEYLDVGILIFSLSLMTWLVLKRRSRKGILWLSIGSLIYFGFIREGCICSIGAVQNITLAIFNPAYSIPVSAILFFAIPLVYALFFGRVFCAGVCPLGAIQDLFAFRPMKLQKWLQSSLALIPYIYLGLSVLYAATATDFIICRYDPFIGIFRLDGTFLTFSLGGIFLLTGIFIARPYCRFLCPYGVILNLFSRVSRKHLTITPAECIQCRLCEDSCPFGAIQKPVMVNIQENRDAAVKRMIWLTLLVPALIIIGVWTGNRFHENLAVVNPIVRLAGNLMLVNEGGTTSEETMVEITAFRSSGKTEAELFDEAKAIITTFRLGSMILGGFIGLVFGLTLLGLSRFYFRKDYTPDKGSCLSCGRCIDYCPVEKELETEIISEKNDKQS